MARGGAKLGESVLDLTIDDSKFHAKMGGAEKKALGFTERVSNAFGSLKKNLGDGFKQGLGIAGGLGAVQAVSSAVSSVVGYLGDAVKAAREETTSVAAMTASLKANSTAFGGNTKAIEATIKERMALGFVDDEQRTSLAFLTAVTKDHNKALELQRIAMDFARLRGMDLATAGDLVGKVYGGNVGILSRYGVQLERGTSSTEALAKIQEMSAGQAEAWANTEEGAAQTAAIAMDELQESIGTKLLPVFTALSLFVRDVVAPSLLWLLDNAIDPLARGIGNVVNSFKEAAGDIQFFLMNFGEMGDETHALADRMGVDFDTMKDRIRDRMLESGDTFSESVDFISSEADRMADNAEGAAHDGMGRMAAGIRDGAGLVVTEAVKVADIPRATMVEAYQALRAAAYQSQVEIAKGLMDGQNAPQVAMDAALQLLEDELTREQEIVRLKGQEIALATAAGIAAQEGKDAARIAIDASLQVVRDRLKFLQSDFYKDGYNIGVAWANGLRSAKDYARLMAWELAASTNPALHGRSPPKEGPLKDIDKGGYNIGVAWAGGLVDAIGAGLHAIESGVGSVGDAMAIMPRIGMPAMPGVAGIATHAAGVGGVAGSVSHITNQWILKVEGDERVIRSKREALDELERMSTSWG